MYYDIHKIRERAPDVFYVGMRQFGEHGVGEFTDGYAPLEDVLEEMIGRGQIEVRIFKIEMDVETNLPETITDVTQEIARMCEELEAKEYLQ